MKATLIYWGWRLLGASIGLLLGGGLGILLGDPISKALKISNFEGGRGYFVFLVLIPLFALAGAILGAIMIYLSWRVNVGLVVILLVPLAIFLVFQRDQFIAPPPRVETFGNFDLLTYTSEEVGDHYGLRYRGKPFAFEGRAGMSGDDTVTYDWLNSVITFTVPITLPISLPGSIAGSILGPVFVVNVGDPNNQSYFYLVREVDGQAKVEHLSDTHSNISADWLDVAPSNPAAARNLTLHRGRLEGGRWLLLGDNCVLDTQTLTAYLFEASPLGDGSDASLNQFKLPLAFSPDQHSFVRLGSSDVRDGGTGNYRGTVAKLIVFNFVERTSYSLPVDRLLMRYNSGEAIDAAWFDHHFAWQPSANAAARLVQRPDFTPLPYHGELTVESDQYRQYSLVPVKRAMFDTLVEFLAQKFKAVKVAEAQSDLTTQTIDLRIGEQILSLRYSNDGYSASDVRLSLFHDEHKLVEEIAKRFDDVLKTGIHDGLFLGDPVALAAPTPTAAPNIAGVEKFSGLSQEHTAEPVTYAQTPPVGGKHHENWINCGVYAEPVKNEMAVHSLEHGAVWLTYQPALPAEQVAILKALTHAGPYRLLSPYPGLPSPIVASAWGLQLKLDNANDPRLAKFVQAYANRADGPEPGASCAGK